MLSRVSIDLANMILQFKPTTGPFNLGPLPVFEDGTFGFQPPGLLSQVSNILFCITIDLANIMLQLKPIVGPSNSGPLPSIEEQTYHQPTGLLGQASMVLPSLAF